MGFFKINTSDEAIRDYSGNSAFINKSGIYEVILKDVVVGESPNGSTFLDFVIEHNGQEQAIYKAVRLTNNDGSANIGMNLFTKLCVIAGAKEGEEIPDPVKREVTLGKDGPEERDVLEFFDNLPVYMRVQMEYSMYEGKIREQKVVRNFFRIEDKATASEIVNDSPEKGKQYALEEEKYANANAYKDGLTEEDVQAWLKERKANKNKATEAKPAVKRRFGK